MILYIAEKKQKKGGSSSSTSSRISTLEMQNKVNRLKRDKHQRTTRKAYYAVWKNFNQFYIRLDVKPPSLEERLTLFLAYLIDMKKQSCTVKSYISAVKSVLRDDGIILNDQLFQLNSLTKACKLVNDKVCTRLPIQRGLLRILQKKVVEYFLENQQPYLVVMYQALFSTAYFGLFRVGELTNGDHPVKACDVHLARNKKKILFVL